MALVVFFTALATFLFLEATIRITTMITTRSTAPAMIAIITHLFMGVFFLESSFGSVSAGVFDESWELNEVLSDSDDLALIITSIVPKSVSLPGPTRVTLTLTVPTPWVTILPSSLISSKLLSWDTNL